MLSGHRIDVLSTQAEIQHEHRSRFFRGRADDEVRRLHVSVDVTDFVQALQSANHLVGDADSRADAETIFRRLLFQFHHRRAQQLHDQVVDFGRVAASDESRHLTRLCLKENGQVWFNFEMETTKDPRPTNQKLLTCNARKTDTSIRRNVI